jgi:hypothetical protein
MAGSRRCGTVRRSFRVAIRLRPTISRCIRLVVGQRRPIAPRNVPHSDLVACSIVTSAGSATTKSTGLRIPTVRSMAVGSPKAVPPYSVRRKV